MNHGTLEKSIRLEKSLFNLIWLRMIKSNTIIDPTQSPPVVVVGEKISDVNGDIMTRQRQLGGVNRTGAEKENRS